MAEFSGFVGVDTSEAEDMIDKQLSALRAMPGQMRRAGKQAAQRAQREHEYQNRTGNAQAETQSYTTSSGDVIITEVSINVPYASYLQARGIAGLDGPVYDLTNELEYLFEGLLDV